MNYIDSACRRKWDSLVDQVDSQTFWVAGRISQLQDSLHNKNFEQANRLSRELSFWENVKRRLDTVDKNLKLIVASTVKYGVKVLPQDSSDIGYTSYDPIFNGLIFSIGGTANFVHETTHGAQFEKGELAFRKDTASKFGDDETDELAAYEMQYAYDFRTIPGLPGDAFSFEVINPYWLRHVENKNRVAIYARRGPVHLALIHLTICSKWRRIRRAYRYLPDYKTTWYPGYQVMKDPKMFFKPQNCKELPK
jgi:hypothetical protein